MQCNKYQNILVIILEGTEKESLHLLAADKSGDW